MLEDKAIWFKLFFMSTELGYIKRLIKNDGEVFQALVLQKPSAGLINVLKFALYGQLVLVLKQLSKLTKVSHYHLR